MQFLIHRIVPAIIAIAFLYASIYVSTRLVGRRMRDVFKFGKPVELAPRTGRIYGVFTACGGGLAGLGFGLLSRPSPIIGAVRFEAVLLAHVLAFYLTRRRGQEKSYNDVLLRSKHKRYFWAVIAPFVVGALVITAAVGSVVPH
ncbi:MAG: hypothetical protein ACYC64_07845 [Armatimonadota bacterium]